METITSERHAHTCNASLQAFSIPGQYHSEDVRLYLPKPTRPSYEQAQSRPYTAHLKEHITFRSTAEAWLLPDALAAKSKQDLRAIEIAFPSLKSPATILSMVAWFSVLCIVDDIVEPMAPKDARQSLLECISVLRLGHIPSSVAAAESTSNRRDSGVEIEAARASHVSQVFRSYIQALLPEYVFRRVCDSVCRVWLGNMTEATFRVEGAVPRTLDEYMELRTRTIGVEPFVLLLESESLAKDHIESETLAVFKKEIEVLVGLQNDILGLEKDLDEGWSMNYISIAAGLEGEESMTEDGTRRIEEAVAQAVYLHNDTLEQAQMLRAMILSSPEQSGESDVVDALYQFSATHFQWASAARRYQV